MPSLTITPQQVIPSLSPSLESNYLSISTGAALQFFKRYAILKTGLVDNYLDIYQFINAGRDNEVRFGSLRAPKHLLRPRNGCTWEPNGKIQFGSDIINILPSKFNGELCPDAFWDQCLEKVFGTGNDIMDFSATPESRALLNAIADKVYEGLGNSFYDLIWFGQDPIITDSNTNNWFTVDAAEWAEFQAQEAIHPGFTYLYDNLKSVEGLPHFNVEIASGDTSGADYTGTATALFDKVLAAGTANMKSLQKNVRAGGILLLVSQGIFTKYENELITEHGSIPEMFYYKYNGEWCAKLGCIGNSTVPGVLKYKGHTVVCMDQWGSFDAMTGVNTHRVVATVPRNHGAAFDVPSLPGKSFDGMSLRLIQKLDPPDYGKLYMYTNFKSGVGIVDTDLMTHASLTLTP